MSNDASQRLRAELAFIPITTGERELRITRLRAMAVEHGVEAVLLGSTSSLSYFTGLRWGPSERLVGALITRDRVLYICPRFELEKVSSEPLVHGDFLTWEEEQNPYEMIRDAAPAGHLVGLDNQLPLFMYYQLATVFGAARLYDAGAIINQLRRCKSPREIAIMGAAMRLTLEVQRRVRVELREGVAASDVVRFIDQQHRALGAADGNSFCIVSFGSDSALPHGGATDRRLAKGDVVLIDTGTRLDGYCSDVTRTYVFGEPSAEVRRTWEIEKSAQAAAFGAAQLGTPCEDVDAAARRVACEAGLGPDYRLPGMPHRTGHGIGLDLHEAPNLVRGDRTPLEVGMCFSNEPMIVVPGRFGIRLEDHFHMTQAGARWFTPPQPSIDDPFADLRPL